MGWQYKLTQTFSVAVTLAVVTVSVTALAMLSHGGKFLSVQSGSMVPTFHKGDLVIDAPLNPHIPLQQQLAVGDVVTYSNPAILHGQPVTHRIVQTTSFANGNHFITKGDANAANDPPITARNIIGKVGHSLPYAGYAADFVRKPLGLVLLVYIPALVIVAGELRRLARYYKAQEPYRLAIAATGKSVESSGHSGVVAVSKASTVVLLIALVVAVPTVQAALHSNATLTPNTISTAALAPTSPNHLLIYQVAFGSPGSPGGSTSSSNSINVTINNNQSAASGSAASSGGSSATSGNASNTSNTNISINVGGSSGSGASTVLPTVIVYNPTAAAVNLAGYTLTDNTNVRTIINGIVAAKGYFTYTWPVAGELSRLGDRMILRSPSTGIDSLSWGSDTSQLNPSVPSAASTPNLVRKSLAVDTNTASDWQ